jgi:tRNA nucleotidyltransferase/poly(A) polymerase
MSLRDELLRRFPHLAALPSGCWIVGGAIRDLLLGIDPADIDVACIDPAAAARAVSPRLIRLGTDDHLSAWRATAGGHVYDFAELLDGEIAADLARRDFTVNAMAVSVDDGRFLDPHGGQGDLRDGLVRMIDPANFDDDPLRCLKGVRMAVRFGFRLDEDTAAAIRTRAQAITGVAAERVTYELSIIFSSGRLRLAVELLRRTGLDVPLFGRIIDDRYHADDVTLAGALALLVADPKSYAKRWRWSSDLLRAVTALQDLSRRSGDLRIALYDAGEEVARQLPPLLRALGRDDAVSMPDFSIRPLLNGEEIASLTGLAPGAELGRIKRALLEAQIRGEVGNRDEARAFAAAFRSPR